MRRITKSNLKKFYRLIEDYLINKANAVVIEDKDWIKSFQINTIAGTLKLHLHKEEYGTELYSLFTKFDDYGLAKQKVTHLGLNPKWNFHCANEQTPEIIVKYITDKIDKVLIKNNIETNDSIRYGTETPEWAEQLNKVKSCQQRQDGLNYQLKDLVVIANRFGFYDAADFIKEKIL